MNPLLAIMLAAIAVSLAVFVLAVLTPPRAVRDSVPQKAPEPYSENPFAVEGGFGVVAQSFGDGRIMVRSTNGVPRTAVEALLRDAADIVQRQNVRLN